MSFINSRACKDSGLFVTEFEVLNNSCILNSRFIGLIIFKNIIQYNIEIIFNNIKYAHVDFQNSTNITNASLLGITEDEGFK